ncbi:MAG: BTAD domain-containing putative transcriptional regulator [Anaerolineae bacterium]|jgi:DNA-binding SARP family transcriptional activator/predicted ATPase
MARLSVRLLGTLQVTLGGSPITDFESDKERALLAFLAEESHQPHRREKLVGLLWPEFTEAAGRNNLRRVLSNLRRTLRDREPPGPPLLLTRQQNVQLNPAADLWVDARAFAALLDPPTQRSIQKLEQATALYRGDFLEGFSLPDSPALEEWVLLCRERYRRLMMAALHCLVEEYERQSRYERALELGWKQLDLEPWWEEAHQQLMRLLALSGRRSEALAQYRRCRRLLAEELDVAPSPETTTLFEQIRDGDLAETTPSLKHRASPIHNLPLATGPFVGRETEIAAIQDCLQDPACRLLTLVGAGGMGKTRLALEAVRDWMTQPQQDGLEGVTLVALASVQSADAIAPTIAQAADFPLSPAREPEQQVLETLRRKRWLLILDSFEHLPDGAGLVAEILRTAPHVKVLVTSRTQLNLQCEHSFPVAGIEFPQRITEDAHDVRSVAAVELFLQAAHRVQPGFELADTDLAEVGRICRQVQGMPLGILLAASWSGMLRPAEIANEIAQSLDFLEADWPDVPERQHSLRAVFEQSWNLLSEPEREVFQVLSVFSGGFTRAIAQQVSGASLSRLRSLAAKSLLQVTPSGRYQIHDLLRQFAAEKLESLSDAATGAHNRHAAYYIAALQSWEADLTGARHQEALGEMETELGNISAAWAWAVERSQVERLGAGMWGLVQFYWHSGRYREGAATLQAAAAAAASAARDVDDKTACLRVWVQALAWQSNFQRAIGQQEAARQLQQQCLEILRDPDLAESDTRLERAILSMATGLTDCMADYAQGRRYFVDSFSLFRALDHRWGMAWALNTSGSMSKFMGEFPDASERFKEALTIYRALDYGPGLAGSLSQLAQIAWLQGRFAEGERLAHEAVATAREAGSRTELANALLSQGEVLEKVGKFEEAHAVFQHSLALYNELGHRYYVTEAHSSLGSVDIHRGRTKEARDRLQTSLALARSQGPPYCISLNLLLLGCLELAEGLHARAYQQLRDATAACQDVGQRDDLSWGFAVLAITAIGLGDRREARRHLSRSFQLAADLGVVPPLLWALPAMALLLAGEGQVERAVELYALASRYPFVAQSRWFADVTGDTLAEIAATLPAERVAILQESGRTRDMEATVAELLAELCE